MKPDHDLITVWHMFNILDELSFNLGDSSFKKDWISATIEVEKWLDEVVDTDHLVLVDHPWWYEVWVEGTEAAAAFKLKYPRAVFLGIFLEGLDDE